MGAWAAVGQQDALGARLPAGVCVGGPGLRAELTSTPCPGVHRQLPGDLGEDLPLHLGPLLVLIALLVSVGHVELQAKAPEQLSATEQRASQTRVSLERLLLPTPEANAVGKCGC